MMSTGAMLLKYTLKNLTWASPSSCSLSKGTQVVLYQGSLTLCTLWTPTDVILAFFTASGWSFSEAGIADSHLHSGLSSFRMLFTVIIAIVYSFSFQKFLGTYCYPSSLKQQQKPLLDKYLPPEHSTSKLQHVWP